MRSFKHILLIVIISVGLAVGLLGMAQAAPAGSMDGEIIIMDNTAENVIDTGGLVFDIKGKLGKLIGAEVRQGDPNKSETVVQGVRHDGNLPSKITIMDNDAKTIVNMGGRLTVQGVSVAR